MEGYKIYLTKNAEVARLIAEAYISRASNDKTVVRVCYGEADSSTKIPMLYHNQGYYCAMIEYRYLDRQMYEINFA